MNRAVEARAMSLRGGARVGIVPSAIVGGGDGEDGIGSTRLVKRIVKLNRWVVILISGRKPAPGTPSLSRASAIWWA